MLRLLFLWVGGLLLRRLCLKVILKLCNDIWVLLGIHELLGLNLSWMLLYGEISLSKLSARILASDLSLSSRILSLEK